MAIIATDGFNRANTTGPDMGTDWTVVDTGGFGTGGLQIVSNTCQPNGLGSDKCELFTNATWPSDQYAQTKVTITGTNTDSGLGVVVRGGSDATLYWAVVCKAASNNVSVAKKIAGSFTLIGRRTATWVDGDTLRLEVEGTTLRVYQNGAQLGADFTDSSVGSGTPGVVYSTAITSGSMDDWEGGNLSVAGPGGRSNLLLVGVG